MFSSYSLNSVAAWVAWVLAGIGAALYAFVNQDYGIAAVLCMGAGATLHVRGFIHELERRDRVAYELGQESIRAVR